MQSLEYFSTQPFIIALKAFFKELNIPINYIADEPAAPGVILGNIFKKENVVHQLINEVYALGMVNDAVFEGTDTFQSVEQVRDLKTDYDGLLIFGITLKERRDNLPITRSQLAEITRAFNRAFPYTPVTIVFKYSHYISFANSERIPYKQSYREGEKVGKVSLLKDIDVNIPHSGHIAILNQLVIPTTGSNAVRNFSELYYYWQTKFSISILNKNFYEEIIGWFNKAVNEIKIPSQTPGSEKHKDFTVRLIARLVFIWFLKELKVVKNEILLPEFDNGDINSLIKPNNNGSSYYKFILQNLFFNALNTDKQERNKKMFDLFASHFNDPNAIKEAIFFSPYLNGGLFDIHPNDWCEFDHANNAFAVPDSLFLDKSIGLNSILSRYKFTIAENTPLEEEIAVDPEMLGRIFENLLAEQSDDTKEAARKNAGAFYTPRPIVSYMCRNTLLKHLDIEIKPENNKLIIHKLLETTVLDPACGSGAFPMGMLEEMMQVLTSVDPDGKVWVAEMMKSKDEQFREHISEMYADGQVRYVKKLGLLRNCLFGIDILEYAIEITKLRCWLSLIVEQKVDFSKDNYNLKPLPNLEFKFHKKNSLFRFYKNNNLNVLIDKIDNNQLLDELLNLENQYFIAKSDTHGTKEEIKEKIIKLLEKVVDMQTESITNQLNAIRTGINRLITSKAAEKEILKSQKKEKSLAEELGNLSIFKNSIKDYFIERVVFPGIFNKENSNPGFDIVIGNPPYVNTKLINSMGISKKLEEEYGFCDDLYNHFTFRGLELLKKGGILSYITSDTFLTLQTKKNMRMEFLGIPKVIQSGDGLFSQEETIIPECQLIEIINTPKAFAALVDTAIFTIKKEKATEKSELIYIDIRKPNANSFNISDEEWIQIKKSKETISSWERILDRTFSALDNISNWKIAHTCDGNTVYRDYNSSLQKYKVSFEPYRIAINFAIFSPSEYNCQILEKIIKPSRPVFDKWWSKIETSKQVEINKKEIINYLHSKEFESFALIGILTEGGQGMATGDNGSYIGLINKSDEALQALEKRPKKLYCAIVEKPEIIIEFPSLKGINSIEDSFNLIKNLSEFEIQNLYDEIKTKFGRRIFGKGFLYRIISKNEIVDLEKQKNEILFCGFNEQNDIYVPYFKGDSRGHRWYSESPFYIKWNKNSVEWYKSKENKEARWQGYDYFFKPGFTWNLILNPNSSYLKVREKPIGVNDIMGMSLCLNDYSIEKIGVKYFITTLNSYLFFKLKLEFFNNTAASQMNDIKKLPIKIPSEKELINFNQKFDECLIIKKKYFSGEIDRKEMNNQLRPIEIEIDKMVNKFYGIEIDEEIEFDDIEEEVPIDEEIENEDE